MIHRFFILYVIAVAVGVIFPSKGYLQNYSNLNFAGGSNTNSPATLPPGLKFFIKEAEEIEGKRIARPGRFVIEKSRINFRNLKSDIDTIIAAYKIDTFRGIDPANIGIVRPILTKLLTLERLWDGTVLNTTGMDREKQFIEVKEMIASMPLIKEKIWLSLRYYDTWANHSEDSVRVVCTETVNLASAFTDYFERGVAYMYVGDFATAHNLEDIAINLFYLAKECFYRSSCSPQQIFYWKKEIYNGLAGLIPLMGNYQGIPRMLKYNYTSEMYHKDTLHQQTVKITGSSIISDQARLSNARFYNYYLNPNYGDHSDALEAMKNWYTATAWERGTRHYNYWDIATILANYNKNESSKTYYLLSLEAAFDDNDPIECFYSLLQLAKSFSLLKQKDSAISYINLAIHLIQRIENRNGFDYYHALWYKAAIFHNLNIYDSALVYANKVLSARTRYHGLKPDNDDHTLDPISQLHEASYYLKHLIYLNISGAVAAKYQRIYRTFEISHLKEFLRLQQIESDYAMRWVGRSIDEAEELNRSIIRANAWARLEEKQTDQVEKTVLILTIALITLFGALLYSEFQKKAKRKQLKLEREKFELKMGAEKQNIQNKLKIQNHTAKNHEFVSLAREIAAVAELEKAKFEELRGSETSELHFAFEKIINTAKAVSKYAKTYFDSSKALVTSLRKELEMSDAFVKVFSMQHNSKYDIDLKIDIESDFIFNELPIPSHFINNFVMNSIKHGLKGLDTSQIEIQVKAFEIGSAYIVEIDDTGCGINYTTANRVSDGTGFSWALDLIEVYNQTINQYKIIFSQSSIIDKGSLGLGRGTKVSIPFIKLQWKS